MFLMGILAWEEYIFCLDIQYSLSFLLGEEVKMVFRRGSLNRNSKWMFTVVFSFNKPLYFSLVSIFLNVPMFAI